MRKLMTNRARRSFSFIPATASLLMILLGSERAGFSEEESDRICAHSKECVVELELANRAKTLAERLSDDKDKKAQLLDISSNSYHRAYKHSNNPDLLISSCTMRDGANSSADACASKSCFMLLLKKHSDSDIVIEHRAYIDQMLSACLEKEAKDNLPQVKWSSTLKLGSSGPIYLKDGEKPWLDYVREVESENREQLKKKFPHHYRTTRAGPVLMGIGLASAIGGGFAALAGVTLCSYGCIVNSPEHILSNNLTSIGGKVALGSFGLFATGTIIWVIPNLFKKYSEYERSSTPIYRRVGYTHVPE